MITGIALVIGAAVFQGIFLLPMARMRDWKWEHIWLAFSLAGMIVFNWILTFISLPHPTLLYAAVPWRELAILAGFGLAWGCGAVLFGLGMDMLGLALGYPLIMGLNASVGTFVPLLWLYGGGQLVASLGMFVAGGYGALRKTPTDAAPLVNVAKLGMGVHGIGALVAIAGGAAFIVVAFRALTRHANPGDASR